MQDYGKWDRRFAALSQRSIFPLILFVIVVTGFILIIGGVAFGAQGYEEMNIITCTLGAVATAIGLLMLFFSLILGEAQKHSQE